ncbi:D-alanyl-D-alanine carboxypeptidase [Candidatus Parcubacteria bacterium]|nr:MAG: D-alanyl-D-alanine carboxypeptidase [Candidatus Parcubacteria bacterium]
MACTLLAAAASFALGTLILSGEPRASSQSASTSLALTEPNNAPTTPQTLRNILEDLPLEAQAAVVVNATTGEVLGEKNAMDPRPLASLTKIFTALAAARGPFAQSHITVRFPLEHTASEDTSPPYADQPSAASAPEDLTVTAPAEARPATTTTQTASTTPPVLQTPEGLPRYNIPSLSAEIRSVSRRAPQEMSLTLPWERALALMMSASSNETADAIASAPWYGKAASPEAARARFMESMNQLARALGTQSVTLQSPSGLDIDDAIPTAVGSPYDIASVVGFILTHEPHIAQATLEQGISLQFPDGSRRYFPNTNPLAWKDARVLFSKTGFTTSAGGNLALAVELSPRHRAIIVVMGSSREGRITDMQRIVEKLVREMRLGNW